MARRFVDSILGAVLGMLMWLAVVMLERRLRKAFRSGAS
jgi:hypothetical protein